MEPRREEPKAPKPHQGEKQKRLRLIRLEERIAPGGGHGKGSNATRCFGYSCESCGGYSVE
jgi:hypothetical protein